VTTICSEAEAKFGPQKTTTAASTDGGGDGSGIHGCRRSPRNQRVLYPMCYCTLFA
jgi:hypothetical protein